MIIFAHNRFFPLNIEINVVRMSEVVFVSVDTDRSKHHFFRDGRSRHSVTNVLSNPLTHLRVKFNYGNERANEL